MKKYLTVLFLAIVWAAFYIAVAKANHVANHSAIKHAAIRGEYDIIRNNWLDDSTASSRVCNL